MPKLQVTHFIQSPNSLQNWLSLNFRCRCYFRDKIMLNSSKNIVTICVLRLMRAVSHAFVISNPQCVEKHSNSCLKAVYASYIRFLRVKAYDFSISHPLVIMIKGLNI